MNDADPQLERLFRAAAGAEEGALEEMPFGFDSRVVNCARVEGKQDLMVVGGLLRRVILLSLGVIVLAGAGFYGDLRRGDDWGTALTDEYTIADNAIGNLLEP